MNENQHMECRSCGGDMVLDEDRIMLVCPYCGNREPLDAATVSRLNSQDDKEAAMHQAEARKQAFAAGRAGVKRVKKAAIVVVVALVALLALGGVINAVEDARWEAEQANRMNNAYTWPTTGLAQKIPQPTQTNGYISNSSSSYFEIEVPCDSENDWIAYVDRLKQAGFDVDAVSSSSSYEAYDEQGYNVSVYYWKYSKPVSMEIRIEEPLVAREISWPTVGVGSLLPAPVPSAGNGKLMGSIESDSPSSFYAVITQMSPADFATYCSACINAGFNKSYNRQDTSFYGYDEAGNHVSLEYRGFNIVEISAYAASK